MSSADFESETVLAQRLIYTHHLGYQQERNPSLIKQRDSRFVNELFTARDQKACYRVLNFVFSDPPSIPQLNLDGFRGYTSRKTFIDRLNRFRRLAAPTYAIVATEHARRQAERAGRGGTLILPKEEPNSSAEDDDLASNTSSVLVPGAFPRQQDLSDTEGQGVDLTRSEDRTALSEHSQSTTSYQSANEDVQSPDNSFQLPLNYHELPRHRIPLPRPYFGVQPRQTPSDPDDGSDLESNTSQQSARPNGRPSGLDKPGEEPEDNDQPDPQDDPIEPIMPTTFPTNWSMKHLYKFKGKDGTELRALDSSVRSVMTAQGLPCYYGGTVRGSMDEGYDYVVRGTDGAKSNYFLGARVMAAIMNTFPPDNNAHRWFVDYMERSEPAPNCWKKAQRETSVPTGVEEVSLYDLLATQYNPDDDVNEAYLELAQMKWDPFKPDAVPFETFRSQMTSLFSRAQLTVWPARRRELLTALPSWLVKDIDITPTEEPYWKALKARIDTRRELKDLQQASSKWRDSASSSTQDSKDKDKKTNGRSKDSTTKNKDSATTKAGGTPTNSNNQNNKKKDEKKSPVCKRCLQADHFSLECTASAPHPDVVKQMAAQREKKKDQAKKAFANFFSPIFFSQSDPIVEDVPLVPQPEKRDVFDLLALPPDHMRNCDPTGVLHSFTDIGGDDRMGYGL